MEEIDELIFEMNFSRSKPETTIFDDWDKAFEPQTAKALSERLKIWGLSSFIGSEELGDITPSELQAKYPQYSLEECSEAIGVGLWKEAELIGYNKQKPQKEAKEMPFEAGSLFCGNLLTDVHLELKHIVAKDGNQAFFNACYRVYPFEVKRMIGGKRVVTSTPYSFSDFDKARIAKACKQVGPSAIVYIEATPVIKDGVKGFMPCARVFKVKSLGWNSQAETAFLTFE